MDHTAPNMNCQVVRNTLAYRTQAKPAADSEPLRIPSAAQRAAVGRQQQQNQVEQETASIMEDTVHKATITREKLEPRRKRNFHENFHEHLRRRR
jgi:hypothetical protein